MSIEYRGSGRYAMRGEIPPQFDGNTDEFKSHIAFETSHNSHGDQNSILIKPKCEEGRNYYGRRHFIENMGV